MRRERRWCWLTRCGRTILDAGGATPIADSHPSTSTPADRSFAEIHGKLLARRVRKASFGRSLEVNVRLILTNDAGARLSIVTVHDRAPRSDHCTDSELLSTHMRCDSAIRLQGRPATDGIPIRENRLRMCMYADGLPWRGVSGVEGGTTPRGPSGHWKSPITDIEGHAAPKPVSHPDSDGTNEHQSKN